MLIVFFMRKELGTMVRHCILTFHPHSMRLLMMYFLMEVVLSERVVEMRSVVLGPDLGI